MKTLWSREDPPDPWLEKFLAGDDPRLDQQLVEHDCRASLAHARMLQDIGILTVDEFTELEDAITEIRELAEKGEFSITASDEDCHTAIENHLTAKCGEAGRKIHTGRSRNDQVLTALRLWEKQQLLALEECLQSHIAALKAVCKRDGNIALPGYTHMQAAMPTTVNNWLGSFVASTEDDRLVLTAVEKIVDQCPLGTAAGFGVPVLKLDREQTAEELGFSRVQENPVYAQLSRGKFEGLFLGACSQIMLGLNRLASDLILYSTREFGYVHLPRRLSTGSSVMPQKRNPDILELVRAQVHVVLAEEQKVKAMTASLMSGYNRDVQLTKAPLMNGVQTTLDCLEAMRRVLTGIEIDKERCAAGLTDDVYSTERVLELVATGVPFRDAYRKVAAVESKRR